jgi:hypothetical protein
MVSSCEEECRWQAELEVKDRRTENSSLKLKSPMEKKEKKGVMRGLGEGR